MPLKSNTGSHLSSTTLANSIMVSATLLCAVYGQGNVFGVEVDLDKNVIALKQIIAGARDSGISRLNIAPSMIKLYLARTEDGSWTRDDDALGTVLAGQHIDHAYTMMRPAMLVSQYVGEPFKAKPGDIHVLVQLPPPRPTQAPVPVAEGTIRRALRVGMNEDAAIYLQPYLQLAAQLKNSPEVSRLVAALHYVASHRSFIALESSCGMGKTQMAFNLMARDGIDVLYIVCEPGQSVGSHQQVYKAFADRSATFQQCIQDDLTLDVGNGEMLPSHRHSEFHTFEFMRALLSGADTTETKTCHYNQVAKLLSERTKPCVVFLDDFPILNPSDSNRTQLRFMRNVLRSLRLPLIIGSSNGTARKTLATEQRRSRGEVKVLWCAVAPEMPRFRLSPQGYRLRTDVEALIHHSRPLFARFALDYDRRVQLSEDASDEQVINFMDGLTAELAKQCRQWKSPSSHWFCVGQLCLFLPANHFQENLIHGHFAILDESELLELRFGTGSTLVSWKTKRTSSGSLEGVEPPDPCLPIWEDCCAVFPSIDEDVLLYLSLLGGKDHRAFENIHCQAISLHEAFEEVGKITQGRRSSKSSGQQSTRLETMTAAAIVAASHWNGFAGVQLDTFLSELVYELGMQRPAKSVWPSAMPTSMCHRVVPFLAPPDREWSPWLPKALNLGSIRCTRSDERIEFEVGDSGWLTCECKGDNYALGWSGIKSILKRIKSTSVVHIVVANWLRASYSSAARFQTFLQEEELRHLQNTVFLRYGVDGRVCGISGMVNDVSAPDRVVLFVERLAPESMPRASEDRRLKLEAGMTATRRPTKIARIT